MNIIKKFNPEFVNKYDSISKTCQYIEEDDLELVFLTLKLRNDCHLFLSVPIVLNETLYLPELSKMKYFKHEKIKEFSYILTDAIIELASDNCLF